MAAMGAELRAAILPLAASSSAAQQSNAAVFALRVRHRTPEPQRARASMEGVRRPEGSSEAAFHTTHASEAVSASGMREGARDGCPFDASLAHA